MRYVSAYMLAAMGAKHHHITANDIENILGSVGVDCEHDKAEEVIKKMHGKTVDEMVAEGSKFLSSVSGAPVAAAGGAPAAADASAAAPADAKGGAAPAAEKKKEEKKEEESDEDMGFGLFD